MEDSSPSLPDPVGRLAKDSFGLSYLYPYQRFVIAALLDRAAASCPGPEGATAGATDRDDQLRQVVILPTGAGKSLCFQLPAPLLPGPSLLVFPLLGLMADQARRLDQAGQPCVELRGGMSRAERAAAIQRLRDKEARIILTNPETLARQDILEELEQLAIFHVVIDEAHCVAEWGDSFRPAYLELGPCLQRIAPAVVTAFTATASPPVLARLGGILFQDRGYKLISSNADRPNLYYEVRSGLSRQRMLRQAVRQERKPLIVFVSSRSGSEICAMDLAIRLPELTVRFYHAGLSRQEKQAVEAWFLGAEEAVLCATCAYGMGMDKKNLRTVIHYDTPASVEAYLQEAGRGGRDGLSAKAILLRVAGQEVREDSASERQRALPAPTTDEAGTQPALSLAGLASERAAVMHAYGHGPACRRNYLLQAMAVEAVVCSGCDACDGREEDEQAGLGAALAWLFRRHARRFRPDQAVELLYGSPGSPAVLGRAWLAGWEADEVAEALRAALAAGLVRLSRWPWPGYLLGGLTPRRSPRRRGGAADTPHPPPRPLHRRPGAEGQP